MLSTRVCDEITGWSSLELLIVQVDFREGFRYPVHNEKASRLLNMESNQFSQELFSRANLLGIEMKVSHGGKRMQIKILTEMNNARDNLIERMDDPK